MLHCCCGSITGENLETEEFEPGESDTEEDLAWLE